MNRLGNRPAQLVRSASRRKKSANRFQFDITIEYVTGLKAGSTHYIKWTRGAKVASTSQFQTPKDAPASGTTVGEKLSLAVTLYREDSKKFDAKEAKMALVTIIPAKKQERTTAKLRFDLSPFAGVPSASTSKVLKLSDRVSLKVNISSRLLKSGVSGPGSAGGFSSVDGGSMRSSDDGDDLDEFDDLALDDVPDPVSVPSSAKSITSTITDSVSASSTSTTKDITSNYVRQQRSLVGASSTNSSSSSSAVQQPKTSDSATQSVSKIPSFSRTLSIEKPNDSSSSEPTKSDKEKSADRDRVIAELQQLAQDRERMVKDLKNENTKLSVRAREAERQRESEGSALRRENDRLAASLKETQRAKNSTSMSNKLHVESLMSRLDDRASQLEDAVSERDQVKKMIHASNKERDDARVELELVRRELYVAKEDGKQLAAVTAQRDEAIQTSKETRSELTVARRDLEEHRLRCKRLEGAEERCAELSRDVDRLTVAAASKGVENANGPDSQDRSMAASTGAQEEVEKRLGKLQEEKESLTRILRSRESHAAKVKATYEELSRMYTQLRSDHTDLQKEAAEARIMARDARASVEAGMERKEETESLRRSINELETSKETLQGNYDQILGKVDTLQDRLDATSQSLLEVQQQLEETQKEKEEMKRQRDVAMQRALSRGKSQTPGPEVDQLRVDKEAAEQERDRLTQAIEQLRKDMGDLKDDVEYERTEKAKAREERDKIRENACTLERRTSQALRTTDALHSLKRELSSSQMRVQDYESMVADLKAENESLREQVEGQQSSRGLGPAMGTDNGSASSSRDDDLAQLVNELVEAKLGVAEAKGEKQQLEFEIHQMKKEERAMQQRLATKASRLEVRLESANQEIERLRSYSGSGSAARRHSTAISKSHDAREFNELGSDVDY